MRQLTLGMVFVLVPILVWAQAGDSGSAISPVPWHGSRSPAGATKVDPARAGAPVAEGLRRPYITVNVAQFRERGEFFDGNARAVGGAVGVFLSPRVSLELDVARPRSFPTNVEQHAPVDISDELRAQLKPGELEGLMALGRTEQQGRVDHSVAGLVGFHPMPWGRVRLGLRAGVGLQHLAWSGTRYVVVVRELGSYTLEPESLGHNDRVGITLVLGLESRIALTRHLAIVPEVRCNLGVQYSNSALRPAIGVRWMF